MGYGDLRGITLEKSDQILGSVMPRQVCDTRAAGRQARKSATMDGRAGSRRRMPRSGASRRPAAALPLYARLPAASPRHRPSAMKRIFARSRCRERPLPGGIGGMPRMSQSVQQRTIATKAMLAEIKAPRPVTAPSFVVASASDRLRAAVVAQKRRHGGVEAVSGLT